MTEQDRPQQHAARTDLSDLVRTRRAELRLSLRALEQRTAGPGGEPVLKYGWLNRLEKAAPGLTIPNGVELDALARALSVPLARVQDAAGAQFWGVQTVWAPSGEARALAVAADELTDEQRAQIHRLIETMLPRRDRGENSA